MQINVDINQLFISTLITLDWLYPSCIPCPDHALCLTPDSEPICSPEYLLKPHILSFGNLLPLSPICVLDRAKEYQSFQIADAAEKWVHEQAGKEECSFYRVSPKVKLARQQIPEEELRKHVEQAKEVCEASVTFHGEIRNRPGIVTHNLLRFFH
jgi:hypothetical protein